MAYIVALLLLTFFEAAFCIHTTNYALRHKQPAAILLKLLIIINLIFIAVFGARTAYIGPLIVNFGSVFYSTCLVIQLLLINKYGKDEALHVLHIGVFTILLTSIIALILGWAPISSDGADRCVQFLAGAHSVRIVTASLLAFTAVLGLVSKLWYKLEKHQFRWFLVYTIAQTVDSFIFYPIAFADFPLITTILSGLFVKLIVGILLYIPYLVCCMLIDEQLCELQSH